MTAFLYKIAEAIGIGDPFHPMFVHITIGTIVASVVFAILAEILKRPHYYNVARYNANLTLVASIITIILGIMDWLYFRNGSTEITYILKLVVSGVLLALLAVTFVLNRKSENKDGSKLLLIMYIANFVTAAVLGYLGGSLVY
jgi:uncharacterized membrane protein